MHNIVATEKGYIIKRPTIRGLVLSGGGAKGIAYSGMLKAMYQQNMVKDLTHLSGASAGAMSTSLIALGMSAEDFEVITNKLNIKNLINLSITGGRADGSRFRNILEIIYLYQVQQIMKDVDEANLSKNGIIDYKILQIKVKVYSDILERFNINNLDELVDFVDSYENFAHLNKAFEMLPTEIRNSSGDEIENQRLTFKDINRLRNILPEDKKNIIKHLSVVTTNQSKGELEVYNEDSHSNCSIAEKVFHSGAHPLLFSAQKNSKHEYIGDGGILDNMPSSILEDLGLTKEEILCAKVDSNNKYQARIDKAMSHQQEQHTWKSRLFDFFLEPFIGGAHKNASLAVREREKIFFNLGNMLYLNSGEIKTTTLNPTNEQLEIAQENGENQTNNFLNQRDIVFSNLLTAMLYLGEEELKIIMNEYDIEKDIDFVTNAFHAQVVFSHQKHLVAMLNSSELGTVNKLAIKEILSDIEFSLQHCELSSDQQNLALALCLKQIDFVTNGKLGDFLLAELSAADSNDSDWIMHLLNLLATPITWIYSLFVTSSEEPVSLENEEHDYQETKKMDIKEVLADRYRLFKGLTNIEPVLVEDNDFSNKNIL